MPFQLTGNQEGLDRLGPGFGEVVCPRHKQSNLVWKQMVKSETRQRGGLGDLRVFLTWMFSYPGCYICIFWSNCGSQGDGVCSHISSSWTSSLQDLFWLSVKPQKNLMLATFFLGWRCTVCLLFMTLFFLKDSKFQWPFSPTYRLSPLATFYTGLSSLENRISVPTI